MHKMIVAIFVTLSTIGFNVPAQATDDGFRFRAATQNIKAGVTSEEVKQDLRKTMKANPDAVGFQEIGGEFRAQVMREFLKGYGYRLVRLDGPAQDNPVAFDDDEYDRVRAFPWHLSDRTFVRVPGAGPRWMRENEATVVILSGYRRTIAFVSLHLVPQPELNRERNELHALQMSNVARLAHRLDDVVDEMVFVGDYNTGEIERLQALVDAGFNHEDFLQTHVNGSLDHVFTTLRPTTEYTVGAVHSDHKLLVVNTRE